MTDTASTTKRVYFDPTINLGHILTAAVFLTSSGIAYATVMSRLDVNEKETMRIERQMKDTVERTERRFEIDQQRDREAFTEIKLLLREINLKLDTKQDKPR